MAIQVFHLHLMYDLMFKFKCLFNASLLSSIWNNLFGALSHKEDHKNIGIYVETKLSFPFLINFLSVQVSEFIAAWLIYQRE